MTSVGPFQLGEPIGDGWFAARDPALDRGVEICVVPAAHLQRAQALARIAHPHVAAVYDVGQVGDGQSIYLAAERVDGQPLEVWARGRRRAEVAGVLLAAGRGLRAAHEAGVAVGFDVVIDREGRARLLVRHFVAADPEDDLRRFTEALRRFVPGRFEGGLEQLLAMLESSRRRRWWWWSPLLLVGVAAVGWKLTRPVCDEGEVSRVWRGARPPGASEAYHIVADRLDEYARAWGTMHRESCEATRVRHVQSAEALDLRSSCLRDALADLKSVAGALDSVDAEHLPLIADSLPPLSACADLERLRGGIPLPGDPAARARIDAAKAKLSEARALRSSGREYSALVTDALALSAGYAPVEVEARLLAATEADRSHDPKSKPELQRIANDAFAAKRDDVAAYAWMQLALLTGYVEEKTKEGLEWDSLAEAAVRRVPPESHLELARLQILGALQDVAENWKEEERVARQGLALSEAADPRGGYNTIEFLDLLGTSLSRQDRNQDALEAHDRAVTLAARVYPPDSQLLAPILYNMTFEYVALHQDEKALKSIERALAIQGKRLPARHPYVLLDRLERGHILLRLKRLDEAERQLRELLPDMEATRSALPHGVQETSAYLAEVLIERGRAREALPLLAHAIDNSQPIPLLLLARGEVEVALHQPRPAVADLEKALKGLLNADERARARAALARAR